MRNSHRCRRAFSLVLAAFVVPVFCESARSDESAKSADASPDYARDVKPLLARKCFACHGALKQSGGLRLDTRGVMLAGGDSGAAVVPTNVQASLLLSAVRGDGDIERMPLESEPLTDAEIELLKTWIAAGALGPDEPLPADPRKYWSFQKLIRPPVPASKNSAATSSAAALHPIDALLAVEHVKRGVTTLPEAEPRTLLRRLYLDLIGLPPNPEETETFVKEYGSTNSPAAREQAYLNVVDKLLASPQYAERWARHWMDVWRYSDWDGYRAEVRESQPHIWRWREWIVDSLHADKPYDDMIVEMLAGDELAPDDPEVLRATGFLARHWFKFNRNVWLESTVEHTGKAFLGLTFNCAKCHDHFFDPISQQDYYSLRAFFEPHQIRTDRLPGQPNTDVDGLVRAYDAAADTPTYLFTRGDEAKPVKERPLSPRVPRLFATEPKIAGVDLPTTAHYPGLRAFVRAEELSRARSDLEQARQALAASKGNDDATARRKLKAAEAALAAVEARLAADEAKYSAKGNDAARDKQAAAAERKYAHLRAVDALADAEQNLAEAQAADKAAKNKPAEQMKLKKAVADAEKKRDDAQKALAAAEANLKKVDGIYTSFGSVYPKQSTGRRLALARWIASPDNPLTARVAANHIWMRHFGEPIVPSVFDFGRNGRLPTNQPLLDWLASELIADGWRMKPLHRQIVTSAAYRRTSNDAGIAAEQNRRHDPENETLWRMNSRRMEAEVLRDSILSVAGTLDLTRGGPDLPPEQAETNPRRSLYFRHSKEKKAELLDVFDRANAVECYRRSESIVPQQALAVANSTMAQTQARTLAKAVVATLDSRSPTSDSSPFISAAFARILNRPPNSEELSLCSEFLAQQTHRLTDAVKLTKFTSGPKAQTPPATDPRQRAYENLVLVLLNHNDFVTIR